MVATNSIFLWEGKIQLGDEPGIYGNASFCGTVLKLPITLININTPGNVDDTLILEITTSDIKVFAGYPGHKLSLYQYQEDPVDPYHYQESILHTERIVSGGNVKITVAIPEFTTKAFVALCFEVDTTVMPGLYDDLIISKIQYNTANSAIYAKFGFQ